MPGVPQHEVTASDFIMVRAALVKTLGGANNALVWSRIYFRTATATSLTIEDDAGLWWPATREDIADETGLTPDQVKYAIKQLMQGEFIVTREHRQGGNYDRKQSYRPLVSSSPVDRADFPDGPGEIAEWAGRESPMDRANMPDLLSSKNLLRQQQEEEQERPPELEIPDDATESLDDLFERFWKLYPRRTARADAIRAYPKALKAHGGSIGHAATAIETAVQAHAAHWRDVEQRPIDRIPYPASWLNGQRWLDELPDRNTPPPGRQLTNAERAIALANSIPEGPHGTQADRAAVSSGISHR